MKYPKEYKAKGNNHIVQFSIIDDEQKFKFLDKDFKIVKDLNPNLPSNQALYLVSNKKEIRISGLFSKGYNKLGGDVHKIQNKVKEKVYFTIQYLNDKELSILALDEALSFKGLISTKDSKHSNLGHSRASDKQGKGATGE